MNANFYQDSLNGSAAARRSGRLRAFGDALVVPSGTPSAAASDARSAGAALAGPSFLS